MSTAREIPKNKRETIRLGFTTYQGLACFDVRVWAKGEGDPVETKKGLTVQVSALPDLAEAIGADLAEARADGLLPPAKNGGAA